MEKIITIGKEDSLYPELLRKIKNPPEKLFCVGNTGLLEKRKLAVIGSRKVSNYGRWVTENMARRASENNIVIVSGMARGADTYAHIGALMGGGNTIAVLGTAIDECYPAENRDIKRRIEEKGLVISEYPPGSKTHKWNFVKRNRIVAGLSEKVIVTEAGLNSGALITAEMAAEYGRDVMAVPGNINNQYNIGSNRLLAEGAMPVINIEDPVYLMGITPDIQKSVLEGLGGDEKRIMKLLMTGEEMTVDNIAGTLGLTTGQVNAIVTILEIKGCVHNSLGKVFVAK